MTIHSTLNTLTILTELGLRVDNQGPQVAPLRNLLIRLNALFMWDQKTFALLNASILSPPKPQFRPVTFSYASPFSFLLGIVSLFRLGITSVSVFLSCQVQSSWDTVNRVLTLQTVSSVGFPKGAPVLWLNSRYGWSESLVTPAQRQVLPPGISSVSCICSLSKLKLSSGSARRCGLVAFLICLVRGQFSEILLATFLVSESIRSWQLWPQMMRKDK